MQALVIAPQPFFSPRGTPFSVYYRTLVLAKLGVKVDLLTYGEGQDVDIPGVRIIRIPRFPFLPPVKVGPSLVKIFLDAFIVLWTVALLLRRRYDYVHAHEEAVFFCRFLKPLFRFQLVYDMHSSLPQQLSNFNFTTSRMLIGAFARLEKQCLAGADAVITICPDLADYAEPLMPDPRRHFLIENSIFDEVRLRAGQAGLSEGTADITLPQGEPVIVYAGTFESYQGLDVLIRAFGRVRQKLPEALLVLAGGTAKQIEAMQNLAQEIGVQEGCVFTGRIAPAQVKCLLRQATMVVSPRVQGTNTPLKIYELLAGGIPLVATRIYSHTQVLDDDVCFLVEPEPESMAIGILTAWRDPELRARLAESARLLYAERYSREAYETKVRRMLHVLAGLPQAKPQVAVEPEVATAGEASYLLEGNEVLDGRAFPAIAAARKGRPI